jgi:hypothetical protein
VDPKSPGTRPDRIIPPVSSQGITEGSLQAADDMKAVIGIYDASLGAKSNETSGVAIRARQREGDVGTFVYIDNFSLAIQRTGLIIVDLIPHIYDTERMVRIVGNDGREELLEINKPVIIDGIERVIHDVTVGAYDVVLEQGPSYSTKRAEAREGMTEFIRAVPAAAALVGDLYAKAQDWPNAEEIGERLEALLPPQVQAALARKRAEAGGQPPILPQGDPTGMQAQGTQVQVEQAKVVGELEKLRLENEGRRLDNKRKELELAIAQQRAMSVPPDNANALESMKLGEPAGCQPPISSLWEINVQLIGEAVAAATAPIAARIDKLAAIFLRPSASTNGN